MVPYYTTSPSAVAGRVLRDPLAACYVELSSATISVLAPQDVLCAKRCCPCLTAPFECVQPEQKQWLSQHSHRPVCSDTHPTKSAKFQSRFLPTSLASRSERMDPHHRKIDLQSAQDLTYLHNNIKNAAVQKLDQAIPLSAAPKGEDDAFRLKVEELVHQVLASSPLLPASLPLLERR